MIRKTNITISSKDFSENLERKTILIIIFDFHKSVNSRNEYEFKFQVLKFGIGNDLDSWYFGLTDLT